MADTAGKRKTASKKNETAAKTVKTKRTAKTSKSAAKVIDESISVYINDISRLYGAEVKREANQENLSQGLRKILMCLNDNDGISQLELTKQTGLSAPTISVTLAKMEADGIISREINSGDLRQVNVCITEEGKKQYETVANYCNTAEEKMLKGFSDEDRKILKDYLVKIIANLEG